MPVFWWIRLDLIFLVGRTASSDVFWGVCDLIMILGSLSAKVGSVGCVGFLVEGSSACVLVDEAGSCLSGGQVCVQWCVWGCL